MLSETVATLQLEETKPLEGKSTETCSSSPPRVIHSHCQHLVDYVKLCMEEGEELTLGEDWMAPLVTELSPYFSYMIYTPNHFNLLSSISLKDSYNPILRLCRRSILPTILYAWQTFYRLIQLSNLN